MFRKKDSNSLRNDHDVFNIPKHNRYSQIVKHYGRGIAKFALISAISIFGSSLYTAYQVGKQLLDGGYRELHLEELKKTQVSQINSIEGILDLYDRVWLDVTTEEYKKMMEYNEFVKDAENKALIESLRISSLSETLNGSLASEIQEALVKESLEAKLNGSSFNSTIDRVLGDYIIRGLSLIAKKEVEGGVTDHFQRIIYGNTVLELGEKLNINNMRNTVEDMLYNTRTILPSLYFIHNSFIEYKGLSDEEKRDFSLLDCLTIIYTESWAKIINGKVNPEDSGQWQINKGRVPYIVSRLSSKSTRFRLPGIDGLKIRSPAINEEILLKDLPSKLAEDFQRYRSFLNTASINNLLGAENKIIIMSHQNYKDKCAEFEEHQNDLANYIRRNNLPSIPKKNGREYFRLCLKYVGHMGGEVYMRTWYDRHFKIPRMFQGYNDSKEFHSFKREMARAHIEQKGFMSKTDYDSPQKLEKEVDRFISNPKYSESLQFDYALLQYYMKVFEKTPDSSGKEKTGSGKKNLKKNIIYQIALCDSINDQLPRLTGSYIIISSLMERGYYKIIDPELLEIMNPPKEYVQLITKNGSE